eukprot:GHRQ01018168.1.p1 GENE.GHRQ01018168.1~~GHRQ01018168.1.p1  ORF type:complete len:143 (-),score=11.42 GHRQ01018168.1:136-564(-)
MQLMYWGLRRMRSAVSLPARRGPSEPVGLASPMAAGAAAAAAVQPATGCCSRSGVPSRLWQLVCNVLSEDHLLARRSDPNRRHNTNEEVISVGACVSAATVSSSRTVQAYQYNHVHWLGCIAQHLVTLLLNNCYLTFRDALS